MPVHLLAALILFSSEIEAPIKPGEFIPDTFIVTGVFAGFSLGDYYHAVFLEEDGEMVSVWAPRHHTPGLDIFLFRHRWELMDATIAEFEAFLPEAGDVVLPTVIDASGGGERYIDWYEEVSQQFDISSQQEFTDHFGNPLTTEDLFEEWLYVNGESRVPPCSTE